MFVIHDELNDGWAKNDILEGWIFTILRTAATTFATKAEAQACIQANYRDCTGRLVIQPA